MDNKLDINVTEKIVSDENILKTVEEALMKKDVKPGDKIFVLNSNRGYLKEPQIEILTVNKVGILYIYTDYDKYKKTNGEAVESSLDVKAFATLEEAETGLFMIKARKYYRNSIKVDDITYSQMKAIFDILGIDTEEVLK